MPRLAGDIDGYRLFNKYDKDRDGRLTRSELGSMMDDFFEAEIALMTKQLERINNGMKGLSLVDRRGIEPLVEAKGSQIRTVKEMKRRASTKAPPPARCAPFTIARSTPPFAPDR